jgi:hypothetical protein
LHTAKSLFDFLFCVTGVHFLPFSLELGKRPGRLGLSSFFCNIRIFFSGLRFYYTFSHKWIPPVFGCRCNADVAHWFLQYSSLTGNGVELMEIERFIFCLARLPAELWMVSWHLSLELVLPKQFSSSKSG